MLALLCRQPGGSPVKCCGLLWKALTNTGRNHTTHSYRLRIKNTAYNKHYLRSSYSLLHHYFKDAVSLRDVKNFVHSFPKLKTLPRCQLEQLIKLIKDDGYSWQEVEMFQQVLLLSPTQYIQRLQLLQSLSVAKPSLYNIIWMIGIFESSLKSLGDKPKDLFRSDPIEHLIASSSNLHLPECVLQGARDLYSSNGTVTLRQVFTHLLKYYLARRFLVEPEVMESFLESTQHSLLWMPLHSFPALCDLISYLQFSFSDLQEQPRLLQLDPINTREIAQQFPHIGGTPIREVAKAVPSLLQVPASLLVCWLRLLQRHKVHHFTCSHHTAALFSTTAFLKVVQRLRILKQLKEWEMIMLSDHLFEILRGEDGIKRLLNTIESGQVVTSLSAALKGSHTSRMKQWRGATPEVVSYTATRLGLPFDEIEEVLAEDIYTPHGINNTKTVLRLLLDYGFTREQVVAGAIALNLEAGVVEHVLKDLHTRPEAQPFAEWMENPFVLHLLAYCVKKDFPHMELPVKK